MFLFLFLGQVAEWSIATVLKTVEPKGSESSNPSLSVYATIAQLVEQLICNQQVGGSNPSGSSKNQNM